MKWKCKRNNRTGGTKRRLGKQNSSSALPARGELRVRTSERKGRKKMAFSSAQLMAE